MTSARRTSVGPSRGRCRIIGARSFRSSCRTGRGVRGPGEFFSAAWRCILLHGVTNRTLSRRGVEEAAEEGWGSESILDEPPYLLGVVRRGVADGAPRGGGFASLFGNSSE